MSGYKYCPNTRINVNSSDSRSLDPSHAKGSVYMLGAGTPRSTAETKTDLAKFSLNVFS